MKVMIPLKDCTWTFEITDLKYGLEANFRWAMSNKDMDGVQFANGGIGSIDCVRLFETEDRCRESITEFAKINDIDKYEVLKVESR